MDDARARIISSIFRRLAVGERLNDTDYRIISETMRNMSEAERDGCVWVILEIMIHEEGR